jgi:outer membrane scaffolding protein for murein synthesis (MipA/OmpV family)
MKKILCATLLLAAAGVQAQTSEFAQLTPTTYLPQSVNFSLGAIGLYMPRYTGSDEHRWALYPMFDGQWKNGAFFSTVSGLGYNFSKDPSLQYGIRMSAEAARDESRSSRLRGLGDVDTAYEPGVFFNYLPSPNYALQSSIRYGSGVDHNAIQVSLGGRATRMLDERNQLTASLAANWANTNYLQSYYGVNATQSAASGYQQFSPSSGLTDIRMGATWNWNIDAKWSLTTGASVRHLLGDASRSPFVFERNPVTIFSTANYRF